MNLMNAYGNANLGTWWKQPERDATQRRQENRNAPTGAKTQGHFPEASLLNLQNEVRQNARRESWIVVVLWVASWGALPLLCV